jgi:hypothetical protein
MSRDPYTHEPQDVSDGKPRRATPRPEPTRSKLQPSARSGTEPRATVERPAAPEGLCQQPEREDLPRSFELRGREYLVRDSEARTLGELGKFRVVAAVDLAKFGYGGDRARMERDIRRLVKQRLVSDQELEISGKKTVRILTLTKTGNRLLRQTGRLPEEQMTYAGLVKPREAKHDADLYRLYQREAQRIERSGGKVTRVVLDYEQKRNLNRDRALHGKCKDDPEEVERLAAKHGLTVVDGKIPVPDLRVEYQDAEMELRRTDLELATRHYRPKGLAEKAKAGFSLYSHPEDAARLRRILDERELTAALLTL